MTEILTERLHLRPPTTDDLDFHAELHSDPRLFAHAPHVLTTDRDRHAKVLESWIAHWEREGFGYHVVTDRSNGTPLGYAGVRRSGDDLNLYYRLRADLHGQGVGREAVRAVVAHMAEFGPRARLQAVIRPGHAPSLRTASTAGLLPAGEVRHPEDDPDEPASVLLEAAHVTRQDRFSATDREQVADLWCRVNDAGGAVGFVPGTPREAVVDALRAHEGQMRKDHAVAGVLRDPSEDIIGIGWWTVEDSRLLAHTRWLWRFMVDPELRGRNLGRILLAGLHRIARDDEAEVVSLDYRSGTGVADFYARSGYVEVGRNPGIIRVSPGDDRDSVTMTRRLDGVVPEPHGGH